MRLRNIAAIGLVLVLVGGGIWAYGSKSSDRAVGAGGLPLIKADTTPIKIQPEEPSEEIIPNGDSTVFSAMGKANEAQEADADPSMDNIIPPTDEAETENIKSDGFAGFKTGFAIPKEPERKAESMFIDSEGTAVEAASSKYVSGMDPEALNEEKTAEKPAEVLVSKTDQTTEPAPIKEEPKVETKKEEPKKETPKQEDKVEAKAEPKPEPEPATEIPPAEPVVLSADYSAQDQEAQEKGLVRPTSKPVAPKPAEEPAQEPTEKPIEKLIEKASEKVAEKAPVKAPEKKEEPVAATGNYYIQVASAPKGNDANALWAKLQSQYPAALGGISPSVQTVTIPGKGDYIRVQAGPLSRDDANKRCTQLREAGSKGGCLVIKR